MPKLVFMKYNVLNIKHLLPEKLATNMELKNHLYIFTQALQPTYLYIRYIITVKKNKSTQGFYIDRKVSMC